MTTNQESASHVETLTQIEQPGGSHPTARSSKKGFFVFSGLLVMAFLVWYLRDDWWPRVEAFVGLKSEVQKPPTRIIPVGTTEVREQNIKLYLNGLGTVTPFKTVTVRARVEGELIRIAFTEGQMVQEGELLAELDKRPFELQRDQAIGQLARDEAALASARLTLDRYEQLLKEKIIPLQQVQEQRAIVDQTIGIIQSDQAAIANAELQIAYCSITAPVSGRIGLRLVDLGNIVRANDPTGIAVINQVRPITIVFTVSQDEIPRIQQRIREQKSLEVLAYDRDFSNLLARGQLLAADNQVDSATGTLRLKAIVEDDADRLFPNQFVNTRLLIDERIGAITVASAAIQQGPEGSFVYVVNADQKVDFRPIQTGPSEANETIVESGLKVGEVVVIEGIDKLKPGAQITLRDQPAGRKEKSSDVTPPAAR